MPSELPAELLSAPLVWVRGGGLFPPLQPLYDGPCAVLRHGPAPSPSESGRGTRWLLSAALRPAAPRMPRLAAHVAAADRRVRAQAVLPQPSGSRSQTRWSLHLLHLWRRHETVPEPFSDPAKEVFACPGPAAPSQVPQTRYLSRQQAPPHRLDL